jgi:pimeloyl-ACP methyl ester carboxylesterase
MDDFMVKPERFKTELIRSAIPTDIFFGTHDDIVPLSSGHWLAENAPNIRLHVLAEGHKLVNERLSDYVIK